MPADGLEDFLAAHAPLAARGRFEEGTCFGEWRVTAYIGRGACGEVYCAIHAMTGVPGALKVLVRNEARARLRFEREARLLAGNAHPAFPRFYAAGEANGHAYLVVELLEPCEPPRGDADVASYMQGICCGLAELHRLGYVHRDLKPVHVMRRADGAYVLVDLGLACEAGAGVVQDGDAPSVVDGRVSGVGTPGYAAPEQFEGGPVSFAADIHALGRMADACFGGKPPRCWRGIVRRATSSLPDYRYPDVAAFSRAIRRRHAGGWATCLVLGLVATGVWTAGRSGAKADTRARTGGEAVVSASSRPESEDVRRCADQDTASPWRTARADVPAKKILWRRVETNLMAGSVPVPVESRSYRIVTNRIEVSEMQLCGATRRVDAPLSLLSGRTYCVEGPGRLEVEFRGPSPDMPAAVVRLRNAALVNRTEESLRAANVRYELDRGAWLVFPKLRDLSGIGAWIDYDARVSAVRFGE